ncbi:MAG TPA: hypothetical protein VLH19_02445 [Patescibacteria group bacterium]|nr:hypothetical protein [Patescibacteria group bacterium]
MKAAIVEDFPDWKEKITKELESHGINVVAKATTKAQGIQLVSQLQKLGVQVLILDGALDQSSDDGNEIGKLCKQIAPDVLRVGMSRYPDGVTEVDIVVGKENLNELAETILSF